MPLNEKNICPYCGAEMLEGFIPYNTPFWQNKVERNN